MRKVAVFFNKEYFILFLIVLFAGTLRFWDLAGTPPSLSHDEVAIGYNAYSILKTGKDEYGVSFPLLFKSFDDYKLPGMVYASVLSIKLFGLNELGVRFPSAFFGTISVFLFYFIIKIFTKKNVGKSLIITLFFAFSLWHINFSRQSFESNGALFFLIAGTYFLFKANEKMRNLYYASFFYAISLYFYYSVRLVIPFLLLSFFIINFRNILKNLRIIFISLIIGIVVTFPLLPSIFSQGGFARINKVSVVNDPNYVVRKEKYALIIAQNNNIFTKIIYNRRIALLQTVVSNYFKNFSYAEIFVKGTGGMGLLYIFELPFFILGIYYLFMSRTPLKWILIAWFLSAPLAGALTTDQPNSLRALLNAPMFSLMSGIGFWAVFKLFKTKPFKYLFLLFSILIFSFYFSKFLNNYFYLYPRTHSLDFGDGNKQMVNYVAQNENKYKEVYISGYYWRPYIYTLFWKAYDPLSYQKDGSINHFEKYYFSAAEWDKEGVYFGPFGKYEIDFYSLVKTSTPQETLFILAKPEFQKYHVKFDIIAKINGKYAREIFVAAVLR
jgi:4-amino-4-deoxy-L-arabinose transferase-like glycosyltransferase